MWSMASSRMPDMKSHHEILMEARRVEQLGAQFAEERRRAIAELMGPVPGPRIVMTFPDSIVTKSDEAEEDELGTTITRRRWIEAGWDDGAVEYRLIEDETEIA